jgi:hypothetical protein
MKSERSVRVIGEAAAVLGVVLSLLFVGLELQQNSVAARAAAYQEMGIAISNTWEATATNPGLAEAINRVLNTDSTRWSELDPTDLLVAEAHLVAVLRLYETVYLQVRLELLDDEALESLGWSGLNNSSFLILLWPRVKSNVTPEFAAYLEESGALVPN